MDTSWLSDFAIFLAVGALALLLCQAHCLMAPSMLNYCRKRYGGAPKRDGSGLKPSPSRRKRYRDRGPSVGEAPRTPILAASVGLAVIAFLIGLSAHTASNWSVEFFGDARVPVFTGEDEVRQGVLVTGKGMELRATRLGRELACHGLVVAIAGPTTTPLEQAMRSSESFAPPPGVDVGRVASELYYHCKNMVSTQGPLATQLDSTQKLIDFVRSTLFVLMIAAASSLTLLLASVLVGRRQPSPVRSVYFVDAKRLSFLLLCIALAFVITREMFTSFEREFNKLAYGNYVSLYREGLVNPVAANRASAASRTPAHEPPCVPGISGAAPAGAGTLLVVHDAKGDSAQPRFALIAWDPEWSYRPLPLISARPIPPPSDLESICSIPGFPDEFLAAESAHYHPNRPGRLFHLRLHRDSSEQGTAIGLVRVFSLPAELKARDESLSDSVFDEIEGIGTYQGADGLVHVLLGERRTGAIFHCRLDDDRRTLTYLDRMELPTASFELPRRISDLVVRAAPEGQVIWVSSTIDRGDYGPFESVVYRAGLLAGSTIQPLEGATLGWRTDGLKIEALCWPDDQEAPMIATDDEWFGGAVRRFAAPGQLR